MAEAEAKATYMVSKAIAEGNVQAVNYFVAQKYVEALKEIATAPNQKLVLMPLEASSVIGAIGGIADPGLADPRHGLGMGVRAVRDPVDRQRAGLEEIPAQYARRRPSHAESSW
jgi:hypothetical protein